MSVIAPDLLAQEGSMREAEPSAQARWVHLSTAGWYLYKVGSVSSSC